MSIVDDAREILNYGSGGHASLSDSPCVYCCFIPHQEECVWLAMPRIVAALEWAQRVTLAWQRRQDRLTGEGLSPAASLGSYGPTLREVRALAEAMRSEPE